MLKWILSSYLLIHGAYALDLPYYHHLSHPTCTCSCQGRIIFAPLPLTEANIIKWATEAVHASFDYGFGNYTSALTSASQYFTQDGFNHYIDGLVTSKNLEIMWDQKLVANTRLIGTPSITVKNDQSNAWQLSLPIQAIYSNANHTLKKQLQITVDVMQLMPENTTQSLAISQLRITTQDE